MPRELIQETLTIQKAAVLAIKAKEEGFTGIIGQHLAIPVTCHPRLFSKVPNHDSYEFLSYVQNKDAALVDARRMEVFWDLYTGLNPKADVQHSPLLCSDLGGLPPACKISPLPVYLRQ